MLSMISRANLSISPKIYAEADLSVPCLGAYNCTPPGDQYILRMPIKTPDTPLTIPDELSWIRPAIERCIDYQKIAFDVHPYIYATSRCGIVRSVTDDEWHVDGFSVRIPHVPEQDYFWCDSYPTEVLRQRFDFPEDFCGLTHNINDYFQDHADESKRESLHPGMIYCLDPYVVHRRPTVPEDTRRAFFRITFVPIPIRVDSNSTPNPLLSLPRFGDEDIRTTLRRYPSKREA